MPRKTLLVLSLALNVAAVLYFIGKRVLINKPVHTYAVSDYITATTEIQAMLPIDSGDIVFVGDSHTSNFPVSELFGAKNRGVASSRIKDIMGRIQPIVRSKPSKIFLECGVNDLLDGRTVTDVFTDYKKLIQVIIPSTTLIIQSTCPVLKDVATDSLNACLKRYCDSIGITFIDLDTVFKKDGKLDSTLTWDGIHLNIEGYKRWYDTVKRFL